MKPNLSAPPEVNGHARPDGWQQLDLAGLGVSAGHWAHREPAPHGEPVV